MTQKTGESVIDIFKKEREAYLNLTKNANNEATKAYLFLQFINSVFKGVKADLVENSVPQLEKYVKFEKNSLLVRGKVDVLLNKMIIEFKNKLNQAEYEDAVSQLSKYIFALYQLNKDINYFCFASDGIKLVALLPRPLTETINRVEDIILDKIDEINLESSSLEEAYLWIDKYLLFEELRIPDTESFLRDFGAKSPTFVESLALLENLFKEKKEKIGTIYDEWASYLGVVYGSKIEDEQSFLKHTYLSSLAKLMIYLLYTDGRVPSKSILPRVINGKLFREWGIINFIDEDFFSWVIREEKGVLLCWDLIKKLSRYQITKIDEDILKGLYQELIDPADRHELGEFYTPDWLAQYITASVLENEPSLKVLDPACGSGTFMFFAVLLKKKKIQTTPKRLLDHITSTVFGIDVHPLAVIIARANYMIALGNLIRIGRTGDIVIPVYLSDSIKILEPEKDPNNLLVFKKVIDQHHTLKLPVLGKGKDIIYDKIIETSKHYAGLVVKGELKSDKGDFKNFLIATVKELKDENDAVFDTLYSTISVLASLIEESRNHIWAFVLKNFFKPASIRNTFDVVIGNPPWLSYRHVRSTEYQLYIKDLITHQYGLCKKPELVTHMELATLFFARTADLYLKTGGKIAFVMPRSVFSGDQHSGFREQSFNINLEIKRIVDLKDVKPLFKVPSCVIFGEKKNED